MDEQEHWQPMETAPKDGSPFLLSYRADDGEDNEVAAVAVAFWDCDTFLTAVPTSKKGATTWGACSMKPGWVFLDGWQPLPPPIALQSGSIRPA